MNRLILVGLCAVLAMSAAERAFAWGSVTGPRGGAAYRGPMGGAAVRGPNGGYAARGPYGGAVARGPAGGTAYRAPGGGYRPYYPGAAVATGVAVGAAVGAATAYSYPPPAYYAAPVAVAPQCGYQPYPPCY
jgi:hypothetical protein